jgi:hypothetical protein
LLKLLKTSTLTITRDNGGGFWDDKGRWTEDATPIDFDILCSIQPFKLGDIQKVLPEGITTNDAVIVRTKTSLKTSEQIGVKEKADTTNLDGFTYEAFFSENWSRFGLSTDHYKVTFLRKDQPSGGSL